MAIVSNTTVEFVRVMKRTFPPGQLLLKVTFIAVCAFIVFDGHHPPAYAQVGRQLQYVPVVTAEDAVQDADIIAINKHLEVTDSTAKDQWKTINDIQSDISGMRGEERVIGAVLGIIASSGLFLQWKRRPPA
jgi:hypothetical protein